MGADRFWMGLMEGSLMAILLWFAFRLFPTISPNARAWLWRLCLLKFGISLLAFGCVNLRVLPAPPTPDDTAVAVQAGYPPQVTTFLAEASVIPTKPEPPPVSAQERAEAFLKLAWMAGALLCFVQFLVATMRTSRLRQGAMPAPSGRLQQLHLSLSAKARLKRPPLLLLSAELDTPSVVGGVRSAVLLPESLPECVSERELELILAHEVAHVKRRDLAWNFAAWCIRTGLCFHPVVWFAARELHFAQESAADQEAVRVTGTAVSVYGEMLLRAMTRSQGGSGRPAAVLSLFDSYRSAHRRLNAMKNFSTRPSLRKSATAAAVFALTLGLLPTYLLVPAQAATSPHHKHHVRHYAHRAAQTGLRVVRVDLHSVIYLDGQKVRTMEPEIVEGPATAKVRVLDAKEARAVLKASKSTTTVYAIKATKPGTASRVQSFSLTTVDAPVPMKVQSLGLSGTTATIVMPPTALNGRTMVINGLTTPPQAPTPLGITVTPLAPQAVLATPVGEQVNGITSTVTLAPTPAGAISGTSGSTYIVGQAPAAPTTSVSTVTIDATQAPAAAPKYSSAIPSTTGTAKDFSVQVAPGQPTTFYYQVTPPKGKVKSDFKVYFGKAPAPSTSGILFVTPSASAFAIQDNPSLWTYPATVSEESRSVIVLKTSKGNVTLKAPKGMVFKIDGSTIEVVPASQAGK